jgi:hypothetical protein
VAPTAIATDPGPNEVQASQLEKRALVEVRRTALADRAMTLASRDFLMLFLELVKPLASLISSLQPSDPLIRRKP